MTLATTTITILGLAGIAIQVLVIILIVKTSWLDVRHRLAWAFLALTPLLAVGQGLSEFLVHPQGEFHATYQALWSFGLTIGMSIGIVMVCRLYHHLILAQRQLHTLAKKDSLTGLLRREAWTQAVIDHLSDQAAKPKTIAVLELDIDHFKRVNDEFGHDIGDEVLQKLAHTCQRALRQEDLIGRLGGEEFVFALPNTNLNKGLEIAHRLKTEIAQKIFPTGRGAIQVTVSIGVTVHSGPLPRDLDDQLRVLIKQADDAMYRAKEAGRNTVCAYTQPPF
jgi:diguanylate cyclase (GGDEF)-like protein